jgi:hypothetical protein
VQAPHWESCSSIHHRAETLVCECVETHTGRRGDRSTPTVYETRRELNRCTRHRGRTQAETYIRGPSLLHRPRPAINPHTNAQTEQHASPSHRPHGPELPTGAGESQCKHCRDASAAYDETTNWVKLESAASHKPPRHQAPTPAEAVARRHHTAGAVLLPEGSTASRRSESRSERTPLV